MRGTLISLQSYKVKENNRARQELLEEISILEALHKETLQADVYSKLQDYHQALNMLAARKPADQLLRKKQTIFFNNLFFPFLKHRKK